MELNLIEANIDTTLSATLKWNLSREIAIRKVFQLAQMLPDLMTFEMCVIFV